MFGESVMNDAVAIVLYRTLVNFNNKGVTFVSLIESAGFFLVIFVGSLAVGVLFAVSATLFFKLLNRHGAHDGHVTLLQKYSHVEMALVMIAPYAAYAAAESMSLSGYSRHPVLRYGHGALHGAEPEPGDCDELQGCVKGSRHPRGDVRVHIHGRRDVLREPGVEVDTVRDRRAVGVHGRESV